MLEELEDDSEDHDARHAKRSRLAAAHANFSETSDATRVKRSRTVAPRANFSEAPWSIMLRSGDLLDHTTQAARLFVRRFRVPHAFFLALVKLIKEKAWFPSTEKDISGRQCIPVELKVR